MRLVVDASAAIRDLIGSGLAGVTPRVLRDERFDLLVAEQTVDEIGRKLPERSAAMVAQGRITVEVREALLRDATLVMTNALSIVAAPMYAGHEALARRRLVDPAHQDDWPVLALALATDSAIWSDDRDFFGCGSPVWATPVLRRELEASDQP